MDKGMSQVQAVRLNMIPEDYNGSKLSASSQDTSLKEKWKKCLSLIKTELPPRTIQTWFNPITPISLTDNVLILRLPSRFLLEWVEPNYGDLLRKSITQIFGENTTVEFLIASSSKEEPEPYLDEEEKEAAVSLMEDSGKSHEFHSDLDHQFTFENYFCVQENDFPREAALHVAHNLGKAKFNPLVFYGGTGVGKTHLIHALGNYIKKQHRKKRLILMSGEQFVHEYVHALQSNHISKFTTSILSGDVLLLDDIQILSNKTRSQEVLLFLFLELAKKRIQVVVTTDAPPSQLIKFNSRLISFLQTGLIVDLPPVDYLTREKLVRHYFDENKVQVNDKIVHFLAENVHDNAHYLKSVLVRIFAQSSLTGKNLTLNEVRYLLSQICSQNGVENGSMSSRKEVTIDDIVNATSDFCGVPVDILVGVSRKKKVIKARQIAIYLSREYTSESLSSIGYHFSNLHHASVLYAYNKVGQELLRNARLKSEIQKIKALL
jgi:chromosomal replication initiator protein